MIRGMLFLLTVIGWSLAASAVHLVIGPGNFTLLPKEHLSFTDTYVDTRAWAVEDVADHPVVTMRLIKARKAGALEHVEGLNENEDVAVQLVTILDNSRQENTRRTQSTRAQLTSRIIGSAMQAGTR